MKKYSLLTVLLLSFFISFAQTKPCTRCLDIKQDTTHKVINDTLVILTFREAQILSEWIDKQNSPHQEIKQIQQFIYDRVKIIPRTTK